jgi:hypothetical protein
LQNELTVIAFVVGAEACLFPGIWVSAVAAPTDVPLEPDLVAFVICLLKALLTDDASRIFLASFAFPSDIPIGKGLGANSFGAT